MARIHSSMFGFKSRAVPYKRKFKGRGKFLSRKSSYKKRLSVGDFTFRNYRFRNKLPSRKSSGKKRRSMSNFTFRQSRFRHKIS